jgi:hypothetical protein
MSKKNRSRWRQIKPAAQSSTATANSYASSDPHATITDPRPAIAEPGSPLGTATSGDFSPISPAQLAANRLNALKSTGPRTEAGLARSSQNAVQSALTGRTVLLPTDNVKEYAEFLADFQKNLKPVGPIESELVQIIVDCHWRLRRIQELEYALYTHGERQFADAFADEPEENRHSMVILQTHLTYQKELRNLHIQEARIDRKRAKALKELTQLQAERYDLNASQSPERSHASESDTAPFASQADFFAALDAGYVPTWLAPYLKAQQADRDNGFVFSNSTSPLTESETFEPENTDKQPEAA